MKNKYNAAQCEALEKAFTALGEQFDNVLIAVSAEVNGEDEELAEYTRIYWHGGNMAALGMAVAAQKQLLEHGASEQLAPE